MASTSRVKICDLPNEIMLSIFSYLPIADLARCAATCEHWHRIVSGCTDLWKGKRYKSTRNPTVCAKTRGVLHALPPLQEVIIESRNGFHLEILYPRMSLALKYTRVLDYCPRLKCEHLIIRLDIAGDMLSHRSTIDFDSLRHLRIQPTSCVDTPLEDYLGLVGGFSQLRTLQIGYHGPHTLSFLRHCSGTLEELKLVNCTALPSGELANLSRLWKLRKLCLIRYRFVESDLASAVAGLANLEVLELRSCSPVRNLSFLQHCIRMQELHIIHWMYQMSNVPMAPPASLWMHELRLPSADVGSFSVNGFTLTAVSLPAALSRLEEMGMSRSCLDYLGALRNCTDLRYICCVFVREPDMRNRYKVYLQIILTRSTQN